MKISTHQGLLLLLLLLSVAGCKKTRTPEEMITRTWQIRTFHTSQPVHVPG
jgi:hypothetical protein